MLVRKGRRLTFAGVFAGCSTGTALPISQLSPVLELSNGEAVAIHNHPSGDARASYEDFKSTQTLSFWLRQRSIVLLDHVIVAKGNWSSMAHDRLLP